MYTSIDHNIICQLYLSKHITNKIQNKKYLLNC